MEKTWHDYLDQAIYLKEHAMFPDLTDVELAKRLFDNDKSKGENV